MGWPGLLNSLSGLAIGMALFIPFYLMRGMGGGDVKLMAAIGAFLGPSQVLVAVLATQIVGGIIGLGYILKYGGLVRLLQGLGLFSLSAFLIKRFGAHANANPLRMRFPYAIAIFFGTGITLWHSGQLKSTLAFLVTNLS
jgi:prepilin peptidase CpaA